MKNNFLLVAVLTALAACSDGAVSQSDGATQADSKATTADASMEQAAITKCPPAFYSPLPDPEIHFGFPFQIARDRVYASDAGATRRGLRLEYIDSDAAQIWAHVRTSMESAGFKQVGEATDELRGNFSKQGTPTIFVSVEAGVLENPSSPDAKGSIWMSWQLERPN